MNVTPNPGQQITYVVLWWLLLEGTGLLVLPLAYRLFRRLPDRGYALAKPLGLVAVNYVLWMSSTLGFLRVPIRCRLPRMVLSIWIQNAGSWETPLWMGQ